MALEIAVFETLKVANTMNSFSHVTSARGDCKLISSFRMASGLARKRWQKTATLSSSCAVQPRNYFRVGVRCISDKKKPAGVTAALGGDSGAGGNLGGTGGSGNSGGDEDGSDGEKHNEKGRNFFKYIIQLIVTSWEARVSMDPNFAFKLGVECLNDAAIIIAVNAASRRSRFFSELEFVICHIAVSLLNDISLVWLLAPVPKAIGSLSKGFISSLPQHCFQAGDFTIAQRLGCYGYKAFLYAGIGFVMGVVGTGLVHGLTAIREKVDSSFKPPSTVQPILKSGIVWFIYMGLSSNTRYQTVNGLERALYGSLPEAAAKGLTVAMRLGNNFLGSMNFVWLAKATRLSQPRDDQSKLTDGFVQGALS